MSEIAIPEKRRLARDALSIAVLGIGIVASVWWVCFLGVLSVRALVWLLGA